MAKQYYEWRFRQTEEILPRSEDSPRDAFFIQIRTMDYLIRRNLQKNNVDDDEYIEEPSGPMKWKSLWVKKDSLLNDEEEARTVLSYILDSIGVPGYLLMRLIQDIEAFGRSIMEQTSNAGRDVLPIVLGFARSTSMETILPENITNHRRAQFDTPAAKRRRMEDSSFCCA